MRRAVGLLLLSFSLLAPSVRAQAEVIHRYDVRIGIGADGTLDVTETIEVTAAGREIVHGIYRDLDLTVIVWGLRKIRDVEVVSVTKDGAPESWHFGDTLDLGGMRRIYVGKEGLRLAPGRYVYEIRYRTRGWLVFHEDEDELYWDAIPHYWTFPIRAARVEVDLPGRFANEQVRVDAWTGEEGARGRDWRLVEKRGDGFVLEATAPFESGEGMTFAVFWPKGAVTPRESGVDLAGNMPSVVAFLGLLLSVLVYWIGWNRVGRDPPVRPLPPRETPPDGISPAAARELRRQRYDQKCMTAALMSLSAGGWIDIERTGRGAMRRFSIVAHGKGRGELHEDEEILHHRLRKEGRIEIGPAHRTVLREARKSHERRLARVLAGAYDRNRRWVIPGFVINLLAVGFSVISGPGAAVGIFLCLWLSIWTLGVTGMLFAIHSTVTDRTWWAAVPLMLFAMPFLAAECLALFLLGMATGVVVPFALIGVGVLAVIFWRAMPRPTDEGMAMLDEIEAYRAWLHDVLPTRLAAAADVDAARDELAPHLPWCVALDLGDGWAEDLNRTIRRSSALAAEADTRIYPHWYRDSLEGTRGDANLTAALGASTGGGFSSSGGGGGSSGGGGGGGGGGGW